MMFLQRQTDKRWSDNIMTSSEDLKGISKKEKITRWGDNEKDTIGDVGCYVTALTNAYNCRFNTVKTVDTVVEELREAKAFWVLHKGKKCPIGKESFLDLDKAKEVFKISSYRHCNRQEIDIKHPNKFYIVRVPYSPPGIMSGHYNFVIGASPDLLHYDSDFGTLRKDWGNYPNYFIIEITFREN